MRSYDFVGRFGGEEFLLTLNNCDPAFGMNRAEAIRKAVGERPVETSSGPISVTMSFGLLLSHEWKHPATEELLHEVDTALYGAKAAGRNCVKAAIPKTPIEDAEVLAPELMRRQR